MIRASRWVFGALVLTFVGTGCASTRGVPQANPYEELLGTWRLEGQIAGALPCEGGASLTFREDGTLFSQSGEQVIRGKYAAIIKAGGFLILTDPVSHNGKSNCQGYSGDFVIENNTPLLYLGIEGDTATLSIGGPGRTPSVVLTRRDEG